MANLVRPPPRSSTERRTRHTLSPVDDVNNTPVTTRHSSRNTAPLTALSDDKPIKHLTQSSAKPAPLARINSRKRPATALNADATPDTRPPTKVTVTQPHGELLRITNGVPKPLGIAQDEVVSGASTPKPTSNGSEAHLAPAQASGTQSQDKRSLRSHDGGSRLKSDLATYFSSYDDVIAGVQKPPEFLDIETPIYIVDEPLKTNPQEPTSPESLRKSASPARSRKSRATSPPRRPSNPLIPASQSSTTFQQLDYSTIAKHLPSDGENDPMADSWYFAQHRRAERKEKQLRNIEKERAMHEKVQLERLLDGLQGPDWLKVMGITGVTDGERKDWEPKRDYFVKEVEALVDKFRIWKEEEKRLRVEKEAALAAQEDDEEEESEESEESEPSRSTARATPAAAEQRPKEPEPPKPRRPPRPHGFLLPYLPVVESAEPFTSFFSKPHLRAAALGKHRHGRGALAFGLAIPDFEEHEFTLPDEYLDPQFLRDNARKRRRQKRESGTSKNSKSRQQPPQPPASQS